MGAGRPVVSGDLGEVGAIELLRQCEERRITGRLRFIGTGPERGVEGVLRLYGGEIAVDQEPRDDGQDPVDLLLDLEAGTYELYMELPPLPVSRGDELERRGSLAVHVPVDLMTYCEAAGLTGVLELTNEGRKAEAFYEAGELLAIELDGRDATDLNEVFAWEQGRFRIAVDPNALERVDIEDAIEEEGGLEDGWAPAPPRKRENTRQFLRVVEMALVDVIDRSEKARSPTRTSPPLPPPPRARPRPDSAPPPPRKKKRRDEQTVKLIYLSGEPSPVRRDEEPSSTRHVRSGAGAEVVGTEAAPERRRGDEGEAMGKKRRKKKGKRSSRSGVGPKKTERQQAVGRRSEGVAEAGPARPSGPPPAPERAWMSILTAGAWALAVIVLGLAILFVLGKLPPVE